MASILDVTDEERAAGRFWAAAYARYLGREAVKRLRCGTCNRVLDKIVADHHGIDSEWGQTHVRHANAGPTSKPEIIRTRKCRLGPGPHFNEMTWRWRCSCGRDWQYREVRLEYAYRDALIGRRRDIVLGVDVR